MNMLFEKILHSKERKVPRRNRLGSSLLFACVVMVVSAHGQPRAGWQDVAASLGSTHHVATDLKQILFAGTRDGWILTPREILLTGDSGASWKSYAPASSISIAGGFRITLKDGWIAATENESGCKNSGMVHGSLYRTFDGGKTWILLSRLRGFDLSSFVNIHFVSKEIGWAMAGCGAVFRTDDGGLTWQLQHLAPEGEYFRDLVFADRDRGWIVGDKVVLSTSNSGLIWRTSYEGIGNLLFDIEISPDGRVWVAGNNGFLIVTNDSGTKWQRTVLPDRFKELWFSRILFVDAFNGWVIGGRGRSADVLRTKDGGITWEDEGLPAGSGFLFDLTVVGPSLIAVGRDKTILKRASKE